MRNFFEKIGKNLDAITDAIYDKILEGLDATNDFVKKAKEMKVAVKINNLVETTDLLRQTSLLIEQTWIDLFYENKKCQMDGAINAPDLLLVICSKDGKLVVEVKSEYLQKEEPTTESQKEAKAIFEKVNKTIDELLARGSVLEIEDLIPMTKTRKIQTLVDLYEKKLSKFVFIVWVKKVVATEKNA